jgi:L-ascorbate metabolism protein UlaG (beta-lactamase superfamily)
VDVKLVYHGHSCFSVLSAQHHLLIDPFLSGNEQSDVKPEQVNPDFILVSHAHGDHLGDAVPIARRTGALVIANYEIANYMTAHDVQAHGMHIGGAHSFPFGRVKLTIAHHGSSFPDGSYGGSPCGFLLWIGDKVIYHAGDTALTYDMTLLRPAGIDAALLPIGDNFTMGPDDCIQAVNFIQPKCAVLMHYNTFSVIAQDAKAVAERVRNETSASPVLLSPGETMLL